MKEAGNIPISVMELHPNLFSILMPETNGVRHTQVIKDITTPKMQQAVQLNVQESATGLLFQF
jgi:hypothetical protein